MVYLYSTSCLRYTILVGNPRYVMRHRQVTLFTTLSICVPVYAPSNFLSRDWVNGQAKHKANLQTAFLKPCNWDANGKMLGLDIKTYTSVNALGSISISLSVCLSRPPDSPPPLSLSLSFCVSVSLYLKIASAYWFPLIRKCFTKSLQRHH